MSGLAPGWEADYDGSRWFYRYKSTGLTQYTFPKAGDEFPEHIGSGTESFGLAPEERLASDRQVKKRGSSDSPIAQGPTEVVSGMSATGYFDPLAWHDDFSTSPDLEAPATSETKETDTASGSPSTIPSLTATPTAPASATLADHSSPGVAAPGLKDESSSVNATAEECTVHMLDGQPIYQELPDTSPAHAATAASSSPVGHVAELASGDTVKCADELAPIEMDGASTIPGFFGTHLNPYTPAELPNEEIPITTQQTGVRGALSGSEQAKPLETPGPLPGPTNNIKAFQPATRPIGGNVDYPRPLSLKPRDNEIKNMDPKRHSIPTSTPSTASTSVQRHPTVLTPATVPKATTTLKSDPVAKGPLRSPVPSILRPARGIASKNNVPIPGANARHGSIQAEAPYPTAKPPDSTMTHVPSVLKPAGRKHLNGQTVRAPHPAQTENRPRAESLEAQHHRASFSSEKIYQRRPVSMLIDQKSASFGFERLSMATSAMPGPSTLQHVSELHGDVIPPRPSTTTPEQSRRDPSYYPAAVHGKSRRSQAQVYSGQLAELPSAEHDPRATAAADHSNKGDVHSESSVQAAFDVSRPTSAAPSEVSSPTVSMLSLHHTPKLAHAHVVVGAQEDSSSDIIATEATQTHDQKDPRAITYVMKNQSRKTPCTEETIVEKVGTTNVEVAPVYRATDSLARRDADAVSMMSDKEWPRAVVDYSGDSWGDEW
ncbi:hypothetical protein G7054_g13040 [Neopestalotiopsis clavispora]|nr:hypothetical protein G7054_g13040 [Neopestalotiopsis clavispora]